MKTDKEKAYDRQWRKANPDKIKAYKKTWCEKNPDKAKEMIRKNNLRPRKKIQSALSKAKLRCTDPANRGYKFYGGKGILYLLDGKEEEAITMLLPMYEKLIAEGKKPSLDRKNSKSHYELSNIRMIDYDLNTKHCDCCILRSSL